MAELQMIMVGDGIDLRQTSQRLQLFPNRPCNGIVPPFTTDIDGYNCNRCATDPYFCMPIVDGDLLSFQFSFPLPISNTNTQGWDDGINTDPSISIAITALDGVDMLLSFGDYVSSYWTGFIDGQYYQTISIDTAQIPIPCFLVKINSQINNVVSPILFETLYSECFTKIKEDCPENTLLLTLTDFCGNEWGQISKLPANPVGQNVQPYIPTVRIRGTIFDRGITTTDKTYSESNVLSSSKDRHNYSIYLEDLIPAYFNNLLSSFAANGTITINNVSYIVESYDITTDGFRWFSGTIELYTENNKTCKSC